MLLPMLLSSPCVGPRHVRTVTPKNDAVMCPQCVLCPQQPQSDTVGGPRRAVNMSNESATVTLVVSCPCRCQQHLLLRQHPC